MRIGQRDREQRLEPEPTLHLITFPLLLECLIRPVRGYPLLSHCQKDTGVGPKKYVQTSCHK